jgi:hypothetical protein
MPQPPEDEGVTVLWSSRYTKEMQRVEQDLYNVTYYHNDYRGHVILVYAEYKEVSKLWGNSDKASIARQLREHALEWEYYLNGECYFLALEKQCSCCGSWSVVDTLGAFYGVEQTKGAAADYFPGIPILDEIEEGC